MGKPKKSNKLRLRRVSKAIKDLYTADEHSLTSVQVEFLKIIRRTSQEQRLLRLIHYRDSAEVNPFVKNCMRVFLEKEIMSEQMNLDEVMLIAYLLREVIDEYN